MRKFILAILAGVALFGSAAAQDSYPAKTITLVTPYAAGGGSDFLTRVLAEAMRKSLGQQVIVQNVEGAGGVIGSGRVASAPPDGYTLLNHHVGMATAPALYANLEFDTLKSFEPIGLWAETPMVLIARKTMPSANMKELVEYIRKNKDKVTFASSGMGSSTHLCAMLLENAVGATTTMIQYKGAAPATLDLQAGRVDLLCDVTAGSIIGHIQNGSVKAYAVTGAKRLESLPNVPTSAEVGLPELNVTAWYGLYAPAGTPKPVIDRLSSALKAVTQDQSVAARLAKMETALLSSSVATPEALRDKLASQMELWRQLIQKARAASAN
jgi:tripartite-type tricarboxylate transporter receptor subunit TctC